MRLIWRKADMRGKKAHGEATQPSIRRPAPVVILVRPQLAENIGMCARAMANFGLSEMRLVARGMAGRRRRN